VADVSHYKDSKSQRLFLFMRNLYTWKLPRTSLRLGNRTAIMGILNVTPDSFSDGGHYFEHEKAVARGKQIEQEGADIIDIGGESSRPGSEEVSEQEEIRRVLPVIEKLAAALRIPISVDTYRSAVAERAMEAGAQLVNDISGLRFDENMARTVANNGSGLVLMHSRGTRDTLHRQTRMTNPVQEVSQSLSSSVEAARCAGVATAAIAVDPGIGFGKAADESLDLLKSLDVFSKLGYPLLVGTSRKSFIRSMVGDNPDARNWGTAATIVGAIMHGAHIVRVHDVAEARVLVDVADRIS
jgi:dihydropteroate synthase